MIGRTRIATSSRKWVVMVPKKNLSGSMLHTAFVMLLFQIACVGTQRKISIKVRIIHHTDDITRSTKIGIRMIEVLNKRQ
jgi:hypothetical protein